MTGIKISSDLRSRAQVVGVVDSPAALARALRLAPGAVDLLEIRVDAFALDTTDLLPALPQLNSPLIITVRHPAEGGANLLTPAKRRALFADFLPFATGIDVEMRSVSSLASIIAAARLRGVSVILSEHHFSTMPSEARLNLTIDRAQTAGADICKIAALTETTADLKRLLDLLIGRHRIPCSVMGMGNFGKISRVLFAFTGSVLSYGYLDQSNASGQWEATLLRQRLSEIAQR